MPIKKGAEGIATEDGAVKLWLMAVVVPDGKAWRWTALCFGDQFDESGSTGPGAP